MRILDAKRVLAAERRGSSWPVVVETDAGPWFTKLRGAAQGTAALAAEIIVASLAESLGLRVPERAIVRLPERIPSEDRHQELRDLLDRSAGENLGFAYLADAVILDAAAIERIAAGDAAAILWLDMLVMNPDRTSRNPNLMLRGDELWLIDHGAAFGFHHGWSPASHAYEAPSRWAPPEAHLLHASIDVVATRDPQLAALLDDGALRRAVSAVPASFFAGANGEQTEASIARRRGAYVDILRSRLAAPRDFWSVPPAPPSAATRRGRPPRWLTGRDGP